MPETLADYLVVAVCPTLIAFFVGSLMFFLIEVFYEGEFKLRVMWVMANFVMAVVCIARIAMEEGWAYASLYAVGIAVAVGLVLPGLAAVSPLVLWPILALVWWVANKLTWDCTLIDDSQDASGQGLLEQMRLEKSGSAMGEAPSGTSTPAGVSATAEPEATTGNSEREFTWWENLFEPDRRPHAPGVWVIYFSLAGLPLFGIGGWFVSASDPDARWWVFRLLVIYVACGMALLLATSFLGLRRYLRQRRLEMPLDMTATWITVGVALILATLALAAILPRPTAEYSVSQLPFRIASAVRQASRFAIGPEGTEDASNPDAATTEAQASQTTNREGKRTGENDSQGKGKTSESSSKGGTSDGGDSKSSQGGEDSRKSQGKDRQTGDSSAPGPGNQTRGDDSNSSQSGKGQRSDKSDAKSKDRNSSSGSSDSSQQSSSEGERQPETPSQNNPTEATPAPQSESRAESSSSLTRLASHIGSALGTLLRWLFYAALLIVGIVLAIVYREELQAAWQKLLAELRELWERWFASKPVAARPSEAVISSPQPQPFAAYPDPFASGAAARMSWPELIRYSFAAVEAWGRERACPRQADQTPHEFANSLALVEPAIAAPVQSLAAMYSQLAYAPRSAASGAIEPIRQLWHNLQGAAE